MESTIITPGLAQGCADFASSKGHGVPREPPGGPGRLKIKPAGEPVNIEEFPRKKKSWNPPALHRFQIDLLQAHAAAGDKLGFVGAFSADRPLRANERFHQLAQSGPGESAPAGFRRDSRRKHELFPKTRGKGTHRGFDDQAGRLGGGAILQLGFNRFPGPVGQPVDLEREPVIEIVQLPGAPGRDFQNRRAADPPMSRQESPALTPLQVRHRDLHLFHRDPGQMPQPWRFDAEGEKGGDRRLDGVT